MITGAFFWTMVDRSGGPDACWPWTGGRHRNGYGRATYVPPQGTPRTTTGRFARQVYAHRLAFFFAFGFWPPMARHFVCDNPPCCNPWHLREGDMHNRQNVADMVAKGRQACGERNGMRTHRGKHWTMFHPERIARGERHGRAKLTDSQRREIVDRYGLSHARWARGSVSFAELARAYDVNESTIARVIRTHPARQRMEPEA